MSCQVIINSSGKILEVKNPQGNDSKLYSDLMNSGFSPETALSLWSIAYTNDFKSEYGASNQEPSIAELNYIIKKLKLSNTGFSFTEKIDIENINESRASEEKGHLSVYVKNDDGSLTDTGLFLKTKKQRLDDLVNAKDELNKEYNKNIENNFIDGYKERYLSAIKKIDEAIEEVSKLNDTDFSESISEIPITLKYTAGNSGKGQRFQKNGINKSYSLKESLGTNNIDENPEIVRVDGTTDKTVFSTSESINSDSTKDLDSRVYLSVMDYFGTRRFINGFQQNISSENNYNKEESASTPIKDLIKEGVFDLIDYYNGDNGRGSAYMSITKFYGQMKGVVSISELDKKKSSSLKLISTFSERFLISGYSETNKDFNTLLIQPFNTGKNEFYYISSNEENLENLKTKFPGYLFQKLTKENYLEATKEIKFNPYVTKNSNKIAIPFKENGKWGSPKLENIIDFIDQSKIVLFNDKAVNIGTEDDPKHTNFITPSIIIDQFLESFPQKKETVIPKEEAKIENVEQAIIPEVKKESKARNIARNISMSKSFNDNSIVITITEDDEQIKVKSPEQKNIFVRNISIDIYNKLKSNNEDIYNSIIKYTNELDRSNDVDLSILYQLTNNMKLIGFQETTLIDDFILDLNYIGVKITKKGYYANVLKSKIALSMDENETDEGVDERADGLKEVFYSDDKSVTMDPAKSIREKLKEVILKLKITESEFDFVKNEFSDNFVNVVDTELKSFKHPSGMPKYVMNYTKFLNEVRELAAPIFEKSETAQKEYETIIKTLKAHSYIAGGQFREFANILEVNKDDLSGAFISYIKTQYTDFVNTKIDTETTEKKKLFSQNDYATKQIIAEDGMLSALFNSNLFKYNEETENYTQDKELIKSILDRKELNKKNAQFDKNEYLKTSSKVFYFFKKDIPLENSDSISREIMAVLNALLDLGLNKKQSIGVLNSYVMQKNNISGLTYLIKETLLRSQLYDFNDKDSFDLLQTKAAEFNQYFVSYDLRRTLSLYRNGKSRFKHIRNSFLYGFTRQIYRYEKQIKTIADPKSTLLEVKNARLEIKDPEILNIIKSPSRLKIVIDFINFKIKIDQATPTQYNDEFIEASDLDNKERRIIALNEFISPYSELHGAKSNMQLPQMGENSTIFYFKASEHIQNPNNSYYYDGKNNLLKVDLGDRNKRVLKSIISNEIERIFSNLNKFNEVVSDGKFNENYEGDFKAGKDYVRLKNGLISNGVGSYFITFPFLNSSEKMTSFLNNGIISIEKIKSFFKEENEEAAIQKFTDSIGDLIIENVIGQVYELKEKLIDDGLIIKNGNFGVFSKEILPINYDEKYSVKSISKNEKHINIFPEGTDHVLFNFLMNNTFSNSYYMAIFNDPSNAVKAIEKDGKLDIQSSIEVTIDNLLKRNKGSITPGSENISEIKASAIIIKKMVADMQITDTEEFKSILEAKAKEQMFLISGKEKFSEFTFNAPPFGTETTVSEYVFNLYEYNKTNTFDDFYVIMEAALKPIFKTYKDIEVGDGVLYSSIDFHLRLKKDLSYITAMEHKILNLIYNQTDIYEYKNAFDGKYSQIKSKELRNLLEQEYPINKNGLDELRKVLTYGLTPMKPVYSTFDKYFKMAEFPIIPLFHSGTNLGNLHDVMKSTRNDIIMYDSASKLLTEDKYNYKFNGEFLTDFTGAPVSDLAEGIPLNMGYYLNQTETQGQTKTEINNASQFYKVLFSNFSMIENGQSLMDDFLDTHYNLLNALSQEFVKKNKLSNTAGAPKFKNLRQLVNYIKDIIQDPGQEVKVDQQIIDSLQLTNDEEYEKLIEIQNNELKDFDRKLFLLSNDDINAKNELLKELSELKAIHEHQRDQVNTGAKWVNNPYFSFGFKKLESVMLSNYRSAIPDFKLKGTAAIISSEANNTFNPRMIENNGPILSNSVIWADGRKSGHSLKDDEIIIPFAYVCSNSKERLYIEDYITVDNNGIQTIDQNKLPKELTTELLRCIGYRVPIQGQNSTAPLKVAGFLNSSFGATCIANKNLIGRMGSDFDSDKLYILLPNVFTDLSVNRNQLFDDYVNSGFVKSGDNYYFNNELLTSNDLINMIKSFMNLKYQYIDSQEYRDELRSKRNELKKVLPKQNLKYSGSSINLVDRSDESIDGYKQNLFEIQYEILTKKELASAITFPNHYGEILEIAKELDFIKEKPAYNPTGYLFIENQRNEAIAGRDGVGVYSIFVTGLTKAQMMKSSLPNFPVVILNGKQHPLNSLYRSLQIDNKAKTSEALQILQSIMVDNLNLGVSGKVNLNKNTFLVAGFMQQLGIPLRETLYIINNKQVMDYFSNVSKLVKNGSKMSDAIFNASGMQAEIKKMVDAKVLNYSNARKVILNSTIGSLFDLDRISNNVKNKQETNYSDIVRFIAGLHFLANQYYSDINALNTDTDNMTAGSTFEISKVNSDFNNSDFKNQFIVHESKYKWGEKDSIFKNYNKFGNENALSLFSETVDGQSISPFANEKFMVDLNQIASKVFNYKTANSIEKMTQILSEFQYYLINLNIENRPTLYNNLITNRAIQKMDASIKTKDSALKQDPFLSSFSIAGKVITFNNINELDYNYINAYYNTETNPEYKELMEAYFTYFLISGEINKSSDFRKLIPTSFINKITDNKLTSIYNSSSILSYIKSYFLMYGLENNFSLPLLTLKKNEDGEIAILKDKMYIDEFDYVKPGKEPFIVNIIQNKKNNVYVYDVLQGAYIKSIKKDSYKSPYLSFYNDSADLITGATDLGDRLFEHEALLEIERIYNNSDHISHKFLKEFYNKSIYTKKTFFEKVAGFRFNLILNGIKKNQESKENKVLEVYGKTINEYLLDFEKIYNENNNIFFIDDAKHGTIISFSDTTIDYTKLVELMYSQVITKAGRLVIDNNLFKKIIKNKNNLIFKKLIDINIPVEYEIQDNNKIVVPELNNTKEPQIATISNETINLIEKDLFSKIISKYTYYFKNNNGEFEKLSNENYNLVKNNNETLYRSSTATSKFAEFSYFMEFYLEKVLNQGIKDLNILDHSSVEDFVNTNTNDEFFLSDPDYAISYEMQKRNLENFSGIKLDQNDKSVADGVRIINNSIAKGEELEVFNMLKPYLESQASKTNTGPNAPLMIGLGLRWDYKVNNPNQKAIEIGKIIYNSENQKNKYGYYELAHNGQPLGEIPYRLKEIISKATKIDASDYDGAIINIYNKNSFISAHNDVDESADAINYPVLVLNIGGDGSLSIEGIESQKAKKGYSSKEYINQPLSSRDAYIFGENGINRDIYHRTLPSDGKGTLPELNIQGKIIPANSYRITITLRRVKPLEENKPKTPNKYLNNKKCP